MKSIYEVLGGNNKRDSKNNVMKSLFVIGFRGNVVEIEAEPYDDAYNTNHIDDTMEKNHTNIGSKRKSNF